MLQPHLSFSPEEELQALELHPAEADASEPPSQQGLERWKASFMNYHRAAGHPSNYNLAIFSKMPANQHGKLKLLMNFDVMTVQPSNWEVPHAAKFRPRVCWDGLL